MKLWLLLFCCNLLALHSTGQTTFMRYADANDANRNEANFRLGFYNVENLFDLKDDSLTSDEAFTPEGENHYTFERYKKKSTGIGRTLLAMGGWQPLEFIGLCEVESRWVMDGLSRYSPLKNVDYEIVHADSPDRRGIDIACMYRPDRFDLILYKYYRITFPFDTTRTTRDMLYVKGILPNSDTLHVFINHWPSRYGGQFQSEPGRKYLAEVLREKVDSLNLRFVSPKIVICGDFNDEPDDLSMTDYLKVKTIPENEGKNELINLMAPIKYQFGTHNFAGEWGVLDQMIVTESLLDDSATYTLPASVGIFDAPWLLTKNAAGNLVPFRTFQGPAYKGGYSDHLPIFLDIYLKPIAQ